MIYLVEGVDHLGDLALHPVHHVVEFVRFVMQFQSKAFLMERLISHHTSSMNKHLLRVHPEVSYRDEKVAYEKHQIRINSFIKSHDNRQQDNCRVDKVEQDVNVVERQVVRTYASVHSIDVKKERGYR